MTAEELLMMSDDVEAYSTDDALVIDAENRIILTPAGGLLLGVESDEESERIKFICPRIVGDNIDLSTLQLRAIYKNANGDKDFRICTDITIDGENIRFSWSLSRKVTRYKGMVNFIICAIRTQSDGSIKNEWNTTLAEGTVLEGLEVDISEEEFEEPKDIVLQLLGMLDEKASDISDAIEAQKAEVISAIQAEEKRVMETIPEDYAYIANLAEENKQLKANAIKRTYSGETIVATDSSQAKFEGLRVFGRSEQVQMTGAQLFDSSVITNRTMHGITTNVNEDGSVSFKGTSVGGVRYIMGVDNPFLTLQAGTYTLAPNNFGLTTEKNVAYSGTFTLDEETTFFNGKFIIVNGQTYSENVYVMLNEGNTELPYEQFTNSKPSPSPELPQSIESVGDDGSVDVGVYGKNLLKYPYKDTSKTINGITYTDNGDGTITANGTAIENADFAILGNTNIDASFISKTKGTILSGNPSGVSGVFIRASDNIVHSYSDMDGNGIEIKTDVRYVYIRVTKGTTVSNIVFKPMIRLTSITDNTYEPYKPNQSLTIPTPNGLPAIKVTDASLATYTDADGVMWVADEIDFARGKYVQRIAKIVFDGSQTFTISNSGVFQYTNILDTYVIDISNQQTLVGVLCDRYLSKTWIQLSDSHEKGCAIRWQNGIGIYDSDFSGVDEFSSFVSENPITVYYILKTPIETDLTAEEIEAYRALTSNYPTTTILNDENAHMEVTFVADTKNHIEQNYVPLDSYKSLEARVLAVEQALA